MPFSKRKRHEDDSGIPSSREHDGGIRVAAPICDQTVPIELQNYQDIEGNGLICDASSLNAKDGWRRCLSYKDDFSWDIRDANKVL